MYFFSTPPKGRIKESHLQGLYCSISYILYTINNLHMRQNLKHCCCYACVKPHLTMEACFFLGIKNKKVIATLSHNVTFYPKNEALFIVMPTIFLIFVSSYLLTVTLILKCYIIFCNVTCNCDFNFVKLWLYILQCDLQFDFIQVTFTYGFVSCNCNFIAHNVILSQLRLYFLFIASSHAYFLRFILRRKQASMFDQ